MSASDGQEIEYTYSGVRNVALALGEVLKPLHLVAEGALELDELIAAGALVTSREFQAGWPHAVVDLPADVGELLLGVIC